MTFDEFLETDRVQTVLVYECDDEIWADTVRIIAGVLYEYSDRDNAWEDAQYNVPFYKETGAKVITEETLLEM